MDPEYRRRVHGQQVASRARRRQTEWEEFVAGNAARGVAACRHEYPNGRRCWKVHPHRHGGVEYPGQV